MDSQRIIVNVLIGWLAALAGLLRDEALRSGLIPLPRWSSMRRLAARLVTAGAALAMCAATASCSATPGLAYAQGGTRPAISPSGPSTAMVPASARGKTATGPMIDVVGAPKGVKAKAAIVV